MTQWGWAIASAVLVITLVQVLVFYYHLRDDDGRLSWPSSASEGPRGRSTQGLTADEASAQERHHRVDDQEDVTRCASCGSPNETDQMFKFCRNCGAEL